MCRLCRWELFTPDKNAIVHVMNRTFDAASCLAMMSFGKLFSTPPGEPHIVEHYRSTKRKQKFTLKPEARLLLTI